MTTSQRGNQGNKHPDLTTFPDSYLLLSPTLYKLICTLLDGELINADQNTRTQGRVEKVFSPEMLES